MISEKEILKGCRKGKPQAQEQLYKLFAPKLMGLCRRYSKSREEAEDIFQEGFAKAFSSLNKLKDDKMLETWLKRIFINTAINYYHQQKKHYHHLDSQDLQFDADDNTTNIIEQLSHQELLAYINQLPDRYRLVFNLYVIEGFKHNEIAKMLDISTGTSKSQLFKAKAFLKDKLASVGFENIASK